jgi:Protein of unknown function (DUF3040)
MASTYSGGIHAAHMGGGFYVGGVFSRPGPDVGLFPGTAQRPVMSLSASERQALDSIRDGLAGSDPELAALLVMFGRLASGEAMPACETVRRGSRPPARRSRRITLRLSLQQIALLLWLVVTIALITVGVVLSHVGSQGSRCTSPLIAACSAPTSAHSPAADFDSG